MDNNNFLNLTLTYDDDKINKDVIQITKDNARFYADSYTIFNRGKSLYDDGSVFKDYLYVNNEFKVSVKGSRGNTYEVKLYLDDEYIKGECTCTYEYACKHGVAALLYLADKKEKFVLDKKESTIQDVKKVYF